MQTLTFGRLQPIYAERHIALFPIRPDKVPAVSHWQKLGLRGSANLARKPAHSTAPAFGFAAGRHSRILVVDIDSTDERVRDDAIARHGESPFMVRSPSGGWHLWYRHNGEGRHVRPFDGLPVDVLGDGAVIAPPSLVTKGAYTALGTLDDLDRLPTARGLESLTGGQIRASGAVPEGRRNALLWRHAMREAHGCGSEAELVFVAREFNEHQCEVPLPDTEVVKVAQSAWRKTSTGQNRFGGHGVFFTADEAKELIGTDPDRFLMEAFLRAHNGSTAEFMATNGWLLNHFRWDRKRIAATRSRLPIELVRPARKGSPAIYRWKSKGGVK